MPRLVRPHALQLYAGSLDAVAGTSPAAAALAKLMDANPAAPAVDRSGTPVALRWTTSHYLGFPRQPFLVYRRPRPVEPRYSTLTSSVSVTSTAPVDMKWGGIGMYEILVTVTPAPGRAIFLQACDIQGKVFPGQEINFTAAGIGRFRTPGIAILRAWGAGVIDSVLGVDQNVYANFPDWQLVEVVGFPFASGEIGVPAYDLLPQGLFPAMLLGTDAAAARIEIARLLQLPFSPTPLATVPAPTWSPPATAPYLDWIRAPGTSALQFIISCLTDTDDIDPARSQHQYIFKLDKQPGIRQLDLPGSTSDPNQLSKIGVPVVATTLASVSMDSFAATALGYGTIDFPPAGKPIKPPPSAAIDSPGNVILAYDYMVTAIVNLPSEGIVELAALVHPLAPPESPANFIVQGRRPAGATNWPRSVHTNRPPAMDAPASESVQLSWDNPAYARGHAVIVSRKAGESDVLNTPWISAIGGFQLFAPSPTRDRTLTDLPPNRVSFVDTVSPVPISGSLLSHYLTASQDVFGRWSKWAVMDYSVGELPVTKPGLHSVSFEADAARATGRKVPCKLVIDFAWDWEDRSPDRIEFTGEFFPPAEKKENLKFVSGFSLAPESAPGPPLVVKFDSTRTPAIQAPYKGVIETLIPDPEPPRSPDPNRPNYRMVLDGFSCNFSSASQYAFQVYARAAEKVRPTTLSEVVGPRVARVFDPLPPLMPAVDPNLRWTALPDATGKARGVLTWPASPGASGYAVWEATESALRHILGASPVELPINTSLRDRAVSLQQLITASQTASLQAFTRLNPRLISETQIEIAIPGSANTLYAYRVSAVSSSNVESERSSSVALMAVPRRNQPGSPNMTLRLARDDQGAITGVQVIVAPTAGATPAGYRVYRIRQEYLTEDIGLMGPPKILESNSGWSDLDIVSLQGTVEKARAIVDEVPEGWFPYFYRAIAVGREDVANGEYSAESLPSATQQISRTPAELRLEEVSLVSVNKDSLLTFNTNLPIAKTPIGNARIEVFRLVPNTRPGGPDRLDREYPPLLSIAPEEVEEGTAYSIPPPSGSPIARPTINRRPPDANGMVEFTMMVDANRSPGLIVVTDPLGRQAFVYLSEFKITDFVFRLVGTAALVEFSAQLPIDSARVGRSLIEIRHSLSGPTLLLIKPDMVPVGPPLSIPPTPVLNPAITRREPDANGMVSFSVLAGREPFGVLLVTDPSGQVAKLINPGEDDV